MTRKYRTFENYLVEKLHDPQEAQAFLDAALEAYEEDGDTEAFMLSLRYITEATGGISQLSKKTKLNRQNLYKILTGETTPRLDTTFSIMKGLGYRLKSEPLEHRAE